jgi:ABC-2 type transport system permease protein
MIPAGQPPGFAAGALPGGGVPLAAGAEGRVVRVLAVDEEGRLFFRLRATIAWQTIRWMLTHARLRLTLVVLLSLMFWASLYGLFYEAFTFLDSLQADVIPLLFNAFFSSLMVMLVFSAGILAYTGLYCSNEARLLLTLPVRPEAILTHKFQEALWFACWGFLLLGSPMLVAYGVVRGSSWPYYVVMVPFMVSFAIIPTTVGTICCLALVAWMPRLRVHALTITVGIACVLGIWFGWSLASRTQVDTLSPAWIEQTFARLAVTEHKLLPSWWLSTGLIESAGKPNDSIASGVSLLEGLKFLALLVANAMLLQLLAGWLARAAYRRGYSALNSETPTRRRRPLGWFDRAFTGSDAAVGRPLRLLMLKDLRIFRRDIAQWSQFVIFFGLLTLYFLNLRSFNYNNSYAAMIGFLNLAVVGLILSTFTTRFIYPMISLEGRRFWILGLLPVHRDQIVWSKFLFAFGGAVLPCCGLVFLSDWMLGLDWRLIIVHEVCCIMLCMGLSGIAVGLGARMPDLREPSPAKISSGFGGTLSLVVSSLFIMAVVITAALPTHLALAFNNQWFGNAWLQRPSLTTALIRWAAGPQAVAVSLVLVVLTGLVATFVPLRLGLRHFRTLEP